MRWPPRSFPERLRDLPQRPGHFRRRSRRMPQRLRDLRRRPRETKNPPRHFPQRPRHFPRRPLQRPFRPEILIPQRLAGTRWPRTSPEPPRIMPPRLWHLRRLRKTTTPSRRGTPPTRRPPGQGRRCSRWAPRSSCGTRGHAHSRSGSILSSRRIISGRGRQKRGHRPRPVAAASAAWNMGDASSPKRLRLSGYTGQLIKRPAHGASGKLEAWSINGLSAMTTYPCLGE